MGLFSLILRSETFKRLSDLTVVPALGQSGRNRGAHKAPTSLHSSEPHPIVFALFQIAARIRRSLHRNTKRAHRKNHDSVSEIG